MYERSPVGEVIVRFAAVVVQYDALVQEAAHHQRRGRSEQK
jgi:hypothetical protein